MKLDLTLLTDEAIALRRLAHELGADLPDAAKTALRDWLIGHNYLELADQIDEDTETKGSA